VITVADISRPTVSGLAHIDALLDQGPGWHWLTPARQTLLYTFSLAGARAADAGTVYTGAVAAFNAQQQAAVVLALEHVSQITGIHFQATTDAHSADIHLLAADLIGASTTGFATSSWSYRFDGRNVVTSYTADAWVYLDNVEFEASHRAPLPGTPGFEVLLHELGHALGLKHPFEGAARLPPAQDNTAHTLMSYHASGGPYSRFAPYDVAALRVLYGGDGLGGALGVGAAGLYLTGTAGPDAIVGGAGHDRLEGLAGDDRLDGGEGRDTAVYVRIRADYQVQPDGAGSLRVQALAGDEGHDSLLRIERLAFSDQSLAFDLEGHAGVTARVLGAVFGPAAVAHAAYAGIGLSLLDAGTTTPALVQLALDARLGPGFSHTALVDLLYANLVGQPPSAEDRAYWTGTLARGEYTPQALAQMAADLELNADNIDLVGLAASGLAYLPAG
jgi:hypothetical protein